MLLPIMEVPQTALLGKKIQYSDLLLPMFFSRLLSLQRKACCKDFNCNYSFGNIKNEGLAEILQGAKLAAIWRKHLERSFAGLKLCARCESVQALLPWWCVKSAGKK